MSTSWPACSSQRPPVLRRMSAGSTLQSSAPSFGCLEPAPANRPSSAAPLAATLPGGDPLAMAVAAGKTPSPEMVAGAGGSGTLRPAVASACLVAILAGLAGAWFLQAQTSRLRHVPLPLSPVELRVAARSALAEIGYSEPPVDTASGFGWTSEYVKHITSLGQSWRDEIAGAVPPPRLLLVPREPDAPGALEPQSAAPHRSIRL